MKRNNDIEEKSIEYLELIAGLLAKLSEDANATSSIKEASATFMATTEEVKA